MDLGNTTTSVCTGISIRRRCYAAGEGENAVQVASVSPRCFRRCRATLRWRVVPGIPSPLTCGTQGEARGEHGMSRSWRVPPPPDQHVMVHCYPQQCRQRALVRAGCLADRESSSWACESGPQGGGCCEPCHTRGPQAPPISSRRPRRLRSSEHRDHTTVLYCNLF